MTLRFSILSNKRTRREVCLSLLVVLLILFGTHHSVFSLAAFAVCCSTMLFTSNTYFLSLMFLIMPMAGIFKLAPNTTSLFTYLELLYVLWHICKRKFKITLGELLGFFFLGYIIITAGFYGSVNITRTLKILVNIMLIGYIAELDGERAHKRLFLYYISGVIASSLICLVNSDFFPIMEYVTEITEQFTGVSIVRFSGLYGDPNYYSVNAIIAMCLLIILYRRKELSFSVAFWLNVLLFVFVGMTGSKSSFLMLVVPILLILYVCIKNRNYWALLACVLVLSGIVILVITGKVQLFDYVLLRLKNTGSSADAFTTGRTKIWRDYIQYLGENPVHLLFGTGASIYLLNGKGAHNTYIDLVYQFGIMGTIIYAATLLNCTRKMKCRFKRNLINGSVLLIILVMYAFLSELLYIDLPFHILLGCMVWNLENEKSGAEQRKEV